MTARLPARYGAQSSLPSRVQDSVSDWSQAWLFSNSPRLPVRSWSAPAAAYLATRVLPSSTTSGGLEPAKAASSLVVMLFHCWSSTLTVSLGWAFFHSALTASTTAGGAGWAWGPPNGWTVPIAVGDPIASPWSMWGELAPPTAPQERLCHGRCSRRWSLRPR